MIFIGWLIKTAETYLIIKIITLTFGRLIPRLPFFEGRIFQMTTPGKVAIFDTTLRDGEQSPGCSMDLEEKVRLARQLETLGVDVIEAGFPIASEGDFAAVSAVASSCREATIAALCRTTETDITRAASALRKALKPRLHTFVATSDIHLEHKLRKTRAEVLEMTRNAVRLARTFCDEVEFSAEDATRSDVDYLCEVLAVAVEEGASVINIPDTVGYTTPTEYGELIQTIRARVVGASHVTISVHCHNDLGLAVANSLAAIAAGARQVECAVNGIGERAGNAALEEIVMAMRVRADRFPLETNVQTEEIYRTSRLLTEIIGVDVQPNKAIVGRNAFAHEAGIHQHGVLNNPLCYEIMTPESVGVPANSIVLGKHSGRHALSKRYVELGCSLTSVELDLAYGRFTQLADKKKRIYDQDILSLLPTQKGAPPEPFQTESAEALNKKWAVSGSY
jgi:2-isopropylmalate synthase